MSHYLHSSVILLPIALHYALFIFKKEDFHILPVENSKRAMMEPFAEVEVAAVAVF